MITNVLDFLESAVKSYPDKIALADANTAYTYQSYQDRAKELASVIIEAISGRTRQPIAVAIGRDADSIIRFMAVVYSGNAYVPLDFSQPEERVLKILDTTRPILVLAGADDLAQHPRVSQKYPLLDCHRTVTATVDQERLDLIRKQSIDTDPLYIIFTTGSTGVPKGIVVSHRSVIDLITRFSEVFAFSNDSIFGNQAPFDFDVSVKDIYNALYCGGTVRVIPQILFSLPLKLIEYLNEHRVNTLIWSTSALRIMENFKALDADKPLYLRDLMFSGEVMPNKVLNYWRNALPDVRYVNLYGPTEITCNCSYYIVDRRFADHEPLPIGVPFHNTRIVLLDNEGQIIQEPGVRGELCVLGSSLALGYYCNEEQTARSFIQNPLNQAYPETLYRTGDIAEYNELGELMFCSRKDDQIKHMGHRIELGEIEQAVNALDYIQASFCRYDLDEERIYLYYLAEEESKRRIMKDLRAFLPKYMLPNVYRHCREFPLNKNNKIDRRRIVDENR